MLLVALAVTLTGCASAEQASMQYKAKQDYASLRKLSRHIAIGMPESAIKNLLGEADFCPGDTQCYYGSDRKILVHKDVPPFTYTLVINFSGPGDGTNRTVKCWELFPVGE